MKLSKKELVTTTLNGLPRSWNAFAVGISSRKEVPSFEELCTSCAQEELRLVSRDRKEKYYQAFAVDFKKTRERRRLSFIIRSEEEVYLLLKGRRTCRKFNAIVVTNLDIIKGIVLRWIITKREKEKKHDSITDINDEHPKKPNLLNFSLK